MAHIEREIAVNVLVRRGVPPLRHAPHATCVITDLRMPGMDAIEVQPRIKLARSKLSGAISYPPAIEMKRGTTPSTKAMLSFSKTVRCGEPPGFRVALTNAREQNMAFLDLIGFSVKIPAVLEQMKIVAPVNCAVLVEGETAQERSDRESYS